MPFAYSQPSSGAFPFLPSSTQQPTQQLAQQPFEVLNFIAVGDFGCRDNSLQTVENIQRANPQLILALGDYSYEPTADCWLEMVDPIDEKIKIVIGNHEVDESPTLLNQYMNHFNLTKQYYSFDYGRVHFLVLSSEDSFSQRSEQYNFAINDLSKASTDPNIDWIIAASHRQFEYNSETSTEDSGSSRFRDIYHPIFEKYNVDLVLLGHQHNYERSYPLKFNSTNSTTPIITDNNKNQYSDPEGQIFAIVGTGGYSLFSFVEPIPEFTAARYKGFGFSNIQISNNPMALDFTFYDNDGSIKDHFVMTKIRSAEDTARMAAAAATTTKLPSAANITSATTKPSPSAAGNATNLTGYHYEPFMTFRGDNFFDIPSNRTLQLADFTTAFWFRTVNRTDTDTPTSTESRQFIVNKGGSGSDDPGSNMNYGLYISNDDGEVRAGFEGVNGTRYLLSSEAPVNDTQWHYAVTTYDGSTVRLYIDGIEQETEVTDGAIPDNTNTLPIRIGANSNSEKYYFLGDVDEVRIWNRALTPSEVKQAYNGVFNTQGQVAYLPEARTDMTSDNS